MFTFFGAADEGAAENLSPVTLAFVGDAVWSLLVRQKLVLEADYPPARLQRLTSERVSAHGQSALLKEVQPLFTEREAAICRRGRNAKKPSHSKNADLAEYNESTGLEAVIGWLYLTGQQERLLSLFGGRI